MFFVRIGTRLYALAGMALVTVCVLSAAALHFVTLAGDTAHDIRRRVQGELMRVSELELLLERHRRIIESAPIELDRDRIVELRARARDIIEEMDVGAHQTRSGPLAAFTDGVPELARQGEATLRLAENFAQAAAIDAVEKYVVHAKSLQNKIALQKFEQLTEVDREVRALVESGVTLTRWVISGSVVALLLIGPFSLVVTRHIVLRLKGMTQTMLQLARNDLSVRISGTRYPDELGDMARALGVFKSNAEALLVYQARIEHLNQRFEFALENMSRGLSMFDAARRLIVCNTHYRELYRLSAQQTAAGTAFETILNERIRVGTGRVGEGEGLPHQPWPMDAPAADQTRDVITLTHALQDGRTIQIAYQPLADGGWVAVHEDITEEHAQDIRIERLAHIDSVTGIANRHAFTAEIERALGSISPQQGLAIHWLDLDRFKEVNDTCGHPVGDTLLQQVATRLCRAVRAGDFVARLGGDEFAVIQRNVSCEADVSPLARRLIATMSQPFDIGDLVVEIGASSGVVIAPTHGRTAEDLIRKADIALYRAKADGRGCPVLYDPVLEASIKSRRRLEADLADAVRTRSFVVHYQPILDLARGEVVTCEALLRWTHPEQGPISPAVFIPIAESAGLIADLGAFVLHRACADAMGWQGDLRVAVNLSAGQFTTGDLLATVRDVLTETGLPATRLELEITETLLLGDEAATIATLDALRTLGVTIALDDFGTGYSSLNYLRRFPVDKIKIDQSFIRDLPNRATCVAIVRSVADLAKTLGMRTVAEGVETNDHLQRVVNAGCDEVQGYLVGRPMPNEALSNAIARARMLSHLVAA